MISRTLVPVDVRPPSPDDLKKTARRTTTYMDDRTVVPTELSDAPPLDGKSTIPSYLPLGVLVDRTLVPRGMPAKPLEKLQEAAQYHSIAILDSRVVVPAYVEPATRGEMRHFERLPHEMTPALREVVAPDVFITGDPNLLIAPTTKRDTKNDAIIRTVSVIVHIGLVIFVIFLPKIFPYHPPTQDEIDLARNQLSFVYSPPETSTPALPPGPKVHIDRKTLNKVAPPVLAPAVPNPPLAQTPPERPAPELPSAPTPHVPVNPAPSQTPPPLEPSHLEPIKPPTPTPGRLNLDLPASSPNKALDDQLRDAINRQGRGSVYTAPGGNLPQGGGGGGRGGPGMQPGVSMLTPTEGIDFNSYLQRLVESVRRNWYAVMPESARMGEKGIVTITFKVYKDGSVRIPDPSLERTSGREPLDAAALSSIRTSSPFEPLPSQFKADFIELRFGFFYNIPVDSSY
jgi:outer membrane biosynthesis protein TonB